MKNFTLQTLFWLFSLPAIAQISVTGSSSNLAVVINEPAVLVDPAFSISTAYSIPGFKVSISSNFNSGDVLAYTGSLPSGVTASYSSATGILTFTGSTSGLNYQTLLRTVTFTTSSTSTTARTITFEAVNGSVVYNSANGHYYSYVSGSYSWTNAKSNAAGRTYFGLQGYLATITNASENTFVQSLPGKGWLGGSDSYTEINTAVGYTAFSNQSLSESKWYWVTGPEAGIRFSNGSSVVTFASWYTGEPNNSSSAEHYVENAWASGAWNDSQNPSSNGYILEFGGMAGDPTVDITHSRTVSLIATQVKTYTKLNSYILQAPAVVVDPNVTVLSTGDITNAKVTISGNFKSGDVLSYTGSLPSGISVSGTGYNASTGVLTFSGTTNASSWQSLFRRVRFSSTSNVSANRDVTFSIGNLVAFSNNHFYESITSTTNWTNAKNLAAAKTYMGMQGYLATITSAAENDFIKQKIGTDAWIGLSDSYQQINAATGVTTYANQSAAEGKWYWVTGPEKGTFITSTNASGGGVGTAVAGQFNNWNNGEPNNVGSEHYGEIYASGSAPGKWNDLNGTQNLMYVVEYGGMEADGQLSFSASTTVVSNSVLPVTGLELDVKHSINVVNINWSTLTEINCDRFDILHSTDGVIYNKIGTSKGHGSTDSKQKYFYVHQTPSYGINYYKLQQFDYDGRFKYSAVKQVNFGTVNTLLAPNPAHSRITIFHKGAGNDHSLIIYNMNGKLMHKEKFSTDKIYVNIQSYPHGLYLAEIKDRYKSTRIMFVKN